MAIKRKAGRVSFNPVVVEKIGGHEFASDDDEVEESAGEDEEKEVVRELEAEAIAAVEEDEDEIGLEDSTTLSVDEAHDLRESYKKMQVAKDTGFNKNDVILVQPEGVTKRRKGNSDVLWKARVVNVRRNTSGNVFLGIEWFYSASQTRALNIPQKTKFQPTKLCGRHELIETNHTDVIARETYVGHLDLYRLTDGDQQEEIEEGKWYTRAFYDLKTRKFKVKTAPCGICDGYYRPETEDEQVFCATCSRWFHDRCLDKEVGQHLQEDHEASIGRLLASNVRAPSTERPPKRSRNGKTSTTNASPRSKGSHAAELRAQSLLRKIAGTRIVRGGEFSMTGMVKEITTARKIVYELENGIRRSLLGTEWATEIGERLVKAAADWPDSAEWCYLCPHCNNTI